LPPHSIATPKQVKEPTFATHNFGSLTTISLEIDFSHTRQLVELGHLYENQWLCQRISFTNILFGFLSWLILLVVSILLYKSGGDLIAPYSTFKVVGTLVGAFFFGSTSS